jgi:hypothetical protein
MNRLTLVRILLCLSATLSFSQQTFVPLVDQSTKIAPINPVGAEQGNLAAQSRILEHYGALPLSFETNHGQTDERVKFLTRTAGYSLFLTQNEVVLSVPGQSHKHISQERTATSLSIPPGDSWHKSGHTFNAAPFSDSVHETSSVRDGATAERITYSVLRMKLRNANPDAAMTGMDELVGKSNYLVGNDPAKWRANIPTYAKVRYEGIYSGIDLVYYGNQRQLEYDFIVAPGANPNRIAFDVRGAKWIRLAADGDLVFKMGKDEIRWHKPAVYQERDGAKQVIAAKYAVADGNLVRFEIAKYDATRTLYIDPLIYSTYLGGSRVDSGRAVAVDSSGNAYVTGKTSSTDFPITSGAFQTAKSGDDDVFVTKFNAGGSALVYSTYLGGSGFASGGANNAAGIAVDGSGNAYITGTTFSTDFPTTPGAFQTACGGDNCQFGDGFVSKLNPTGSALLFSSYLGGSSFNTSEGIAVDSAGNVYVTGSTSSTDFPITPGAFQTTYRGGFVTKFNPTGSALIYSTFLGGTGLDGFGRDRGFGIAVDNAGNAYVTGLTGSKDFPTTPGAFQTVCDGGGFGCSSNGFVTKLNPTGSDLIYSTYLGGTDIDWGASIAIDSSGNAYVTGTTYSRDFPITTGGFQTTCNGTDDDFFYCRDAFVTKINPQGSALVYSNYLGGASYDWGVGISVDSSGHAYVIGYTQSLDFPTKHPLQPTISDQLSAFVTKLTPEGRALDYSTYLGSIGGFSTDYEGIFFMAEPTVGIAVDSSGNAYVTGRTESYTFPTMNSLQPFLVGPSNVFVAKISAAPSDITLSPLHLHFRNQPRGVASLQQGSTLSNTSSTNLSITSIGVTGTNSGDFAQTNNCGASLQPGASCSIMVTFTPKAIGNRSAAVKIVASAPRQWISLTGFGLLETVTTLTSNKNPSALGDRVTFKVTVSSPAGGVPSGTINIRDGGVSLVTKTLNAGTATFATTKLPLGLNAITVHYPGDAAYGFSDASLSENVLSASTTTVLTSLPNPSVYGQAVTFNAKVTPNTGPMPPNGELVSFMKGMTVLGTGALSNGSASFTTATLPAVKNFVVAVYGGDSNLVGSTSKIVEQVVNKSNTTTTLVSSQNPSILNQSVTFTASVTSSFGGTVTGGVIFYDGATKVGSSQLSAGKAKFTTSRLSAGSHTISATYVGSASFTGSSASRTQIVN